MAVLLRDYQQDWVQSIRVAMRSNKRVLGVLPTGGGKCLGRGTPILMFDGCVKAVEDVVVGDMLMGPDSAPRFVVSLARGREQMVRVIPKKGTPYVVNRSHVLSFKMTSGSRHACGGVQDGEIVNLTVDEYRAKSRTFHHCAKGWRTGVDFPRQSEPLRLPPYFVGLWLGDGTSLLPAITTGDVEIRRYVHELAAEHGLGVRVEKNSVNSDILHMHIEAGVCGRGQRLNPIKRALHEYGLLGKKHVPIRYLTGLREDRLALLAGFLDADGHLHNNCYEATLKDERLANDILYLARSLGFAAYSCSVKKTCGNNGVTGSYWRLTICGDVDQIPLKIARKVARPRKQKKDPLLFGVTLEDLGEDDYFGFEIDGPNHLFLLGDFTVTHNTVCFSHIGQTVVERRLRVYFLAHRIEIIRQIGQALAREGVRHGFIAPGYPESSALAQVGMVQTVANRLDRLPPPALIITDEAHHAIAAAYMRILDRWKDAFSLGVTATPGRLDGKGLGDAYDVMVQGPTMRELQDRGYLARYNYYAPPVVAQLGNLKKQGGDFATAEVAAAMDKAGVTGDAIQHYRKHLNGKPAIAFCASVEHAKHVAEAFRQAGWKADSVDGSMEKHVRNNLIAAIGNGGLNVLTSCDIISEGTDIPSVQGAILLRPTLSLVIFMQQCGRVLRLKHDNSRAIILDHVGNVFRHGMPDAPRDWDLSGAPKRPQAAAVRQCPECYLAHAPAPQCPVCDYVYPVVAAAPARKILEATPGELARIESIEQAKLTPLKVAMSRVQSFEDLQALGKARGYHHLWARRQWVYVKARLDREAREASFMEERVA